MLGALMLSPARHVISDVMPPLRTYNVPEITPPPPEPQPAQAQPRPSAPSVVRAPRVIVPTDRADPNNILADEPSDERVSFASPGSRIEAEPAPPPALPLPLRVAAAVDLRFADDFQPPYPRPLERREVEGIATVRVLIGADGRVKQVVPVVADDLLFHSATAAQALGRWRFRPARRDGVPEEGWRTMTVRFTLPG